MKKRIISLVLAMAMCFALGITSFAAEPPTLHQTMMNLSPGYEPLAWSNWIGPYVERSSKHCFIEDAVDFAGVIAEIYDSLTFDIQDIAEYTVEEICADYWIDYAKDLWKDTALQLVLMNIDNVYYRASHKWRYNEATSQMQHNFMLELYADEGYYEMIDVITDTAIYYQNINRSI